MFLPSVKSDLPFFFLKKRFKFDCWRFCEACELLQVEQRMFRVFRVGREIFSISSDFIKGVDDKEWTNSSFS